METINQQNPNLLSHFADMSTSELKENVRELKEFLLVMKAKEHAESPDAVFISHKEMFDKLLVKYG
ncbi:MAG: hypothetical protein HRU03_06450 [Nanoarchaeales archaeon]|nr:hypothetical protein [Nanoarchaeales archaeon]